jgi:prepilin-type N-terminal cleavage/methylation domain-containing protein
MWKKIINNKSGFSLTEVMIAVMILAVAVVTATNLLVGLMKSNRLITQNLQAHFLATEGIEAVKNIRDSNWLNNMDFRGEREFLGLFEEDKYYVVFAREGAWVDIGDVITENADINSLNYFLPWEVQELETDDEGNIKDDVQAAICVKNETDRYFSDCSSGKETEFKRYISISTACNSDEMMSDVEYCKHSMKVTSTVYWEREEISLDTVLTDWKGGVL